MSRLSTLDLTKLDAKQQAVYEAIASGPRKGVRGPFLVWLHRGGLAEHAQALGRYCRYDTCLPPRLSELAICLMGRIWQAEYEWAAHKNIAIQVGIAPEIIEAIRTGVRPQFSQPDEELIYDFVTTLHATRSIDEALYARAVSILGESGVVDLTGIIGYYSLISATCKVFDLPPHAGTPPELPNL